MLSTRTLSPYFSPKKAMAPRLLASAMGSTSVWRAGCCSTRTLTRSSTFCRSSAVSGAKCEKSKRSRSGADQRALLRRRVRPARVAAPSAADGWPSGCGGWRPAARRPPSSLTLSPTRSSPDGSLPKWTNSEGSGRRVSVTSIVAPGRRRASGVAHLAALLAIKGRLPDHDPDARHRPRGGADDGTEAPSATSARISLSASRRPRSPGRWWRRPGPATFWNTPRPRPRPNRRSRRGGAARPSWRRSRPRRPAGRAPRPPPGSDRAESHRCRTGGKRDRRAQPRSGRPWPRSSNRRTPRSRVSRKRRSSCSMTSSMTLLRSTSSGYTSPISRDHPLGDVRQEGLADAKQPAVVDGPPHDPTQHVLAAGLVGEHAVGDQEGGRPRVIGDRAQRHRGRAGRCSPRARSSCRPGRAAWSISGRSRSVS